MNLEQFGQEFQQLRERRGRTQDEVIAASRAYENARSLRKIESGEGRPKRYTVISLLVKGLDEHDGAVIDHFLELAGYEPLREKEYPPLGLKVREIAPPAPRPVADNEASEPPQTVGRQPLIAWRVLLAACVAAAVAADVKLHHPFLIVTSFLYAALYAVSVFLESTYDYKGTVTVLAACVSFGVIWATSAAALWIEMSMPTVLGLWVAIAIFMIAGVGQWLLVRPALSDTANVPTAFQSLTGRTAHLKNTGYFLIFVFSFWALPVHCVSAAQTAMSAHELVLCPKPGYLWILLLMYFGASIPMGHTLLSKFLADRRFDLYVTLFFTRAILGLFLCVICIIWYTYSTSS